MKIETAKCSLCKVVFETVGLFDGHLPCAASGPVEEPYAAGLGPEAPSLPLSVPSAGRVGRERGSVSRKSPSRKTRPRLPSIGVSFDLTGNR